MKTKLLTVVGFGSLALSVWAQAPRPLLPNEKQFSVTSSSVALLDSMLSFGSWNASQNKWDYSFKSVYSYNTHGKEDGKLFYILNASGWQIAGRYINYQFDSQQNCTEKTYEQIYNHNWLPNFKDQSTYDAANHLLAIVQLQYNSGVWQNTDKWICTYTGNHLASYTHQLWDFPSLAWKNDFRFSYTYNTSDQTISELQEIWKAGAWVNSRRRFNYVYNGTDLIGTESAKWDTVSASFQTDYMTTYTYDVNHHLLNELVVRWDAATSTWENATKASYTVDANGNRASSLDQLWNKTSNSWVNKYKSLYYYRNAFTGIHESESTTQSLVVWPNPAGSFVQFTGMEEPATIRVSDLSGKVLINKPMGALESGMLNTESLAPGLYLLEMTNAKARSIGKFVKL